MAHDASQNNPKKELAFAVVGVGMFLAIVLGIGVSGWLRPAGSHEVATVSATEEGRKLEEALKAIETPKAEEETPATTEEGSAQAETQADIQDGVAQALEDKDVNTEGVETLDELAEAVTDSTDSTTQTEPASAEPAKTE